MLKAYLSLPLTGRTRDEALRDSDNAHAVASVFGITLLDPVREEGIKPGAGLIQASATALEDFWQRDKELMRASHVLIDLNGAAKSEGVSKELGYMRYHLHRPVIRVYPTLGEASIARIEDDVIAPNLFSAMAIASDLWGTRSKRLIWRFNLFERCFFSYLKTRILETIDWI